MAEIDTHGLFDPGHLRACPLLYALELAALGSDLYVTIPARATALGRWRFILVSCGNLQQWWIADLDVQTRIAGATGPVTQD